MVTQTADGAVEFRFYRPQAGQVFLAGDFTSWQESCLRMAVDADGWWRCRLRIAPGFYQFRYLADQEWFTDYAAFGVEPTSFGLNSVLKVDAPAVVAPVVSAPSRKSRKTERQAA
jgi:1,4-alpha-glucan branching enzyme